MPVPATSGQLRTKLSDMQIGDYIVCNYRAAIGVAGTFNNLGGVAGTEISVPADGVPNGSFYLIKVDKGLSIADRILQGTISWDTLNTAKFMEGRPYVLSNIPSMTSDSAPSGTVIPSTFGGAGYEGYKAFDGSSTSAWSNANPSSLPHTLEYDYPSPKVIKSYAFSSGSGGYPTQWKFQAYDNTTSAWIDLDSRSLASYPTTGVLLNFNLSNNIAYSKYRLYITAFSTATFVYVYEMQLSESPIEVIRSLSGGIAWTDASGKLVITNPNNPEAYCFPTNNEYDTYIRKSTLGGKVTADDDNVWHHKAAGFSWVRDTVAIGVATSDNHVARGYPSFSTARGNYNYNVSSYSSAVFGFRPVFQYIE